MLKQEDNIRGPKMVKFRIFDKHVAKKFLGRYIPKTEFISSELSRKSDKIGERLFKSSKSEERKIWDDASKLYFTAIKSRRKSLKTLTEFFRNVKLMPGSKILFLGSGAGLEEAIIASRFPRTKCTFIDFSEEMHKLAKKIIKKEGLKNVRLVLGDMEQLPIKERQDFVCAFGLSLQHLLKFPGRITEARGIISNAQHARFVMGASFLEEEIPKFTDLIKKGGFEIEKIIPCSQIGPGYNIQLIVAKPIQIRL